MFLAEALQQYIDKHGRKPVKIFITPAAALTLAARRELVKYVQGVRIVSLNFGLADCSESAKSLGIFLRTKTQLASCDVYKE